MALLHTPYDGSSQPFSVGLKPIADEDWLEVDDRLEEQLLEKKRLLAERHDRVFRAEAETLAAQREVLDLVLSHLASRGSAKYQLSGATVEVAGLTVPLDLLAPLEAAARIVQEDLVLMRKGADGYRLAAACLCFPSSWSLAEKYSRSMAEIHESVPGFNDGRMGTVVARLFDNLKVCQLVCRYNWSIYDDPKLHHPEPRQIAPDVGSDQMRALARLFVRVERQTLRRLPVSGDILFTIKVHHDPIDCLRRHPDRVQLAGGLRDQLLALDAQQLAYKGLTAHRSTLAAMLERLTD